MDSNQQYSPAYLAEDRGRELIDVAIVFAILETFFMILFFTSRIINRTLNGWDVYLMIPGYLFCLVHIAIAVVMVRYCGTGRHVAALEPAVVIRWQRLDVVEVFMYPVSITLPKLAILCLYGRIFTPRPYRYAICITGCLIILTFLAAVASNAAICQPFSYMWDQSISNGHCGNVIILYRYFSVPNLFTDVCMIVLPLHGVWGLQVKVIQKIGIAVTFLTGCVGIITGIIRLVYFFKLDLFADVSWYSVSLMTWTLAEPGVYLIAASLLSLRPLVRYVFKDVKWEMLYNSLLDRWSCGFCTRKHSKDSPGDMVLDHAIGGKTTRTIGGGGGGGGVRFAGLVKTPDLDTQSKATVDDEVDWVAGVDEDMQLEA